MKALLGSLLLVAAAGDIGVVVLNYSKTVLNNGVTMPLLALQAEKYPHQDIEGIVKMALKAGIQAIDAATQDQCQLRVGAALKNVQRNSYFLMSGIMLQQNISSTSAYAAATAHLQSVLGNLGVQHVDLMVISRPATTCGAIQEQWRALEDFHAAGKARAIGLREFCPASLKCLMQTAKVTPALNQIFYHVGMGVDPEGFKSAFDEAGVMTQSIGALDYGQKRFSYWVGRIGNDHEWSGAQVSMRWLLDSGVPLSVPMSNMSHITEAQAIFGDYLTAGDMVQLDKVTLKDDCPVFCPSSRICPPLDQPRVV